MTSQNYAIQSKLMYLRSIELQEPYADLQYQIAQLDIDLQWLKGQHQLDLTDLSKTGERREITRKAIHDTTLKLVYSRLKNAKI